MGQKPAGTGPVRVGMRYRMPTHRAEGFKDGLRDLRLTRLRNGARHWQIEQTDEPGGQTELTERITYASWNEYARSFSRSTKWDVMLESVAREYHVATDPPEEVQRGFDVVPRGTAGRGTTPGIPVGGSRKALEIRVADAIDRAIDEVFIAYDRLSTTRKRKTAWKHMIVEFPASIPDPNEQRPK
jgi:hypothetical protein